MNRSVSLPSVDALKAQAKRLRAQMSAGGNPVSHSRSLELLAQQFGYKDWNTIHAAAGNRSPSARLVPGQRVSGQYLGQAFEGEITGIQTFARADRTRITVRFDQPVDVVTFDGFSNFRQRVSCIVGEDLATVERTSDGRPQLSLQA